MADSTPPKRPTLRRHIYLTLLACGMIGAIAAGLIILIQNTEPTAQRVSATRKSAALVETLVVSNGTYRPVMAVLGTVDAERKIVLSPRVSGQVISLAPEMTPGGFVRAGQRVLTIDPADFENTLVMRESDVRSAEALLQIEQGRRIVAEKEFALLDQEIGAGNRALVLREPQIASAQAAVASAKAALKQARLALARTNVEAPFDAQILSRNVNIGSQVSPGDALAHLVGVETYRVVTSLPLSDLDRLTLPQGGQLGARVRVRHRTAWASGVYREGHLETVIGTVDQHTRLARVLVAVDDPLSRNGDAPPLVLNTVVEVQIEGREIANVVRLDRQWLREGNTVWLFVDETLEIRVVEIAFEDAQYAYINAGLADGDAIVTTTLATAAPGIGLKCVDATRDDSL
ncbi:MAG: RND family efflux transporter MFP subunit [Candidatus Promineifilaceae bacterium]|jgi:RND family efflux transporter MFP subunit